MTRHAIVTTASKLRINDNWDLESRVTARALRTAARRCDHLTGEAAEHEREITRCSKRYVARQLFKQLERTT